MNRSINSSGAAVCATRRCSARTPFCRTHQRPRNAAVYSSSSGNATSSSNANTASGDKWEEQLSVHATLSSLYSPGLQLDPTKQLDHAARRAAREMAEVTAAAARLGLREASVRDGAAALAALVPGLQPCNLDAMRASDWAKLLSAGGERAASALLALRSALPRADVASIVARSPRLLLRAPATLEAAAAETRALLTEGGCGDPDAVLTAVPALVDPSELRAALAALRNAFPKEDVFALLQADPNIARSLGGETEIEADPDYSEITTAG